LYGYSKHLAALGRHAESLAAAEESCALYRQVDDPESLARALTALGARLAQVGRCDEAVAAAAEAIDIHENLPPERTWWAPKAGVLWGYALVCMKAGKPSAKALEAVEQSIAIYDKAAQPNRRAFMEMYGGELGAARSVRADLLDALGRVGKPQSSGGGWGCDDSDPDGEPSAKVPPSHGRGEPDVGQRGSGGREPVAFIAGALAAGAAAVRDDAPNTVKVAYGRLRDAASARLAGQPDGERALEQHQADPQAGGEPLMAELARAGAGSDARLAAAAAAVMKLLDPAGPEAGRYEIRISAEGPSPPPAVQPADPASTITAPPLGPRSAFPANPPSDPSLRLPEGGWAGPGKARRWRWTGYIVLAGLVAWMTYELAGIIGVVIAIVLEAALAVWWPLAVTLLSPLVLNALAPVTWRIAYLQVILRWSENHLGAEEPGTLQAAALLARYLLEAGRLAQAMRLAEALTPVTARVFGPEHRETLTIAEGLVICYSLAGRRHDAVTLGRDVVARMAASGHPDQAALNKIVLDIASGRPAPPR
jgi:hypothetical protein